MTKELATIKSASLEMQERGILTFWIIVDYENGCSQGVGGIALDTWYEVKGTRKGTAYGCELIRQLLLCMNVNDFSEMAGKNIFVLGEGQDLSFTPKGIQALRSDGGKKVVFNEIFSDMKE